MACRAYLSTTCRCKSDRETIEYMGKYCKNALDVMLTFKNSNHPNKKNMKDVLTKRWYI